MVPPHNGVLSMIRRPSLSGRAVHLQAAVALTVATVTYGGSNTARAEITTTAPGFALNRFEPAGPGSSWFTLESLDFRGTARPAMGIVGGYAYKPLVLYGNDKQELATLVNHQITLQLGVGINLYDRFRVNAALPVIVAQRGFTPEAVGPQVYAAASGASAGDLRLGADVRLMGEHGDPLRLAIGTQVFVPTGKTAAYASDGKFRVAPRLLLAGDVGAVAYAARVGFQYRGAHLDPTLFQGDGASVGNEVFGALAIGIHPVPEVLVGPEIFGATVLTDSNSFKPRSTPLEVLFGAHVTVAEDWHLGAGISPGLTQGLGSPALRVLAQVEYFPAVPPPDRDGDRIFDRDDACPDVPGVRTGNPKTHGCPRPPKDRDKDGILDKDDACPNVPGIATDDPATHGCPPPKPPKDRDKDGILDDADACPDIPGMKTDSPKTNGCADQDGDTILDPEDACPEQPGPADPDPAKNGCPIARVEKGQIRILEQVKFKFNSHIILPESDYILNAVKQALAEHPEIQQIRVEGHTDNRGASVYNKKLSDRRAASVADWLRAHGIDRGRLLSQGFGRERPLATNKTETGRAQNRRVEFHIVGPKKDDGAQP